MTTEIIRCSIVQFVAIGRQANGDRQRAVLFGSEPWTRRDYALLERLRDVRGINVIEDHTHGTINVTICGTVSRDGFTRRI